MLVDYINNIAVIPLSKLNVCLFEICFRKLILCDIPQLIHNPPKVTSKNKQ